MSFEGALEALKRRVERFDELRGKTAGSLPRSRAAVFDSVYELLNKVAQILRVLSQLESALGQASAYGRVCGGALARAGGGVTFAKLRPLRAVSYSPDRGTVRLAYGNVSVEIGGDEIAVSLGRLSRAIRYTDPADLANNAAAYGALLSKVMAVPDELLRTVVPCARSVGVKL